MKPFVPQAAAPANWEFVGGQVCLDFANTVGGLRGAGAVAHEYLPGYADLVAWSQQAGLLSAGEAAALLETATHSPGEAAAALERAYALREVIYRLFDALTADAAPAAADLDALNGEIEQGMAGAHIVAAAEGFRLAWRSAEGALDQMLGPIARSAATLLTSAELGLLRQCASETCGWLFLDTTKNHRRQWCTMAGCGNRARVQRHRQRNSEKEGRKRLLEESPI
jgi:predicted RNA-binding Zn ribbon-like protein